MESIVSENVISTGRCGCGLKATRVSARFRGSGACTRARRVVGGLVASG